MDYPSVPDFRRVSAGHKARLGRNWGSCVCVWTQQSRVCYDSVLFFLTPETLLSADLISSMFRIHPELNCLSPQPSVQSGTRPPLPLTCVTTVPSSPLFLLPPLLVLDLPSRVVLSAQIEIMSSVLPDKIESWGPCTFGPQTAATLERVYDMVVFRGRTTGIGRW